MHFVTLILFSISCSFTFGDDVSYNYYDQMKADDAINDDINDSDQLSGKDDKNDGIEDDNDQLDRTIDAIKQADAGNDGVDDSDNYDYVNIDNNKISAGNIGTDNSKEAVLDDSDNEDPHLQSEAHQNDGEIDNDETVLDASDNEMDNPVYIKNDPSLLSKLNLGNDEVDVKQYQLELAAGDLSELLGNAHHDDPRYYKELSRRFVPVYPYEKSPKRSLRDNGDRDIVPIRKKVKKHRKPNPEDIIRLFLSPKRTLRDNEDRDIVPIRAPPELVLAAMKNGTKKYAAKPSEPTEEVIRQYMLRSGDYWDNVWKEEVVPSSPLRTKKQHKKSSDSLPITAKLVPGTKLYDLLAGIVKKTPKLVYIINK